MCKQVWRDVLTVMVAQGSCTTYDVGKMLLPAEPSRRKVRDAGARFLQGLTSCGLVDVTYHCNRRRFSVSGVGLKALHPDSRVDETMEADRLAELARHQRPTPSERRAWALGIANRALLRGDAGLVVARYLALAGDWDKCWEVINKIEPESWGDRDYWFIWLMARQHVSDAAYLANPSSLEYAGRVVW